MAVLTPPKTERLQLKTVLCAVDFSEFSRRALHYATEIARHFQSRLFVQHTIHLPPTAFWDSAEPALLRESLRAARQNAELELRRLLIETNLDGTNLTPVLNEGEVRERILQTILDRRIDLLVMGTHGRKGLNRLVLGSVAERIVHEATCPVLVISRPQTEFAELEAGEPLRLQTILLATDFSRNSDRALTYALRWAAEWSGKVILFHAVGAEPTALKSISTLLPEYNPHLERQIAEAWEKIRTLVPDPGRAGCEIDYEVRDGDPREQILHCAAETKPDLIIMGARGLGRSGLAWGSTISGVVRDGRFPVLAIRHLGK